MSSKTAKTPKISQFFSPTSKNGDMEGTKGKKRVVESAKTVVPKKAKLQKTEKGGKKKKEKSAIKRASSAYIFFSKDFRNKLTVECKKKGEPVPKVNEVAKLCGQRWKEMTDEDKKPFQKLADLDRCRYHKETGKDVVKKDSEKPKRAPTAYFIFLAEFRKEMAKSNGKDEKSGGQKIPSLAGEKWRSMSDKEKEPFVKKEAEEKKKYEAAMEEYRKKVKDAPKPEKKSKPKKKEEPEEEEDEEEDEDDEEEEEDDDDDDDAEAEDEDDDDE